jgi:hypothetical protein
MDILYFLYSIQTKLTNVLDIWLNSLSWEPLPQTESLQVREIAVCRHGLLLKTCLRDLMKRFHSNFIWRDTESYTEVKWDDDKALTYWWILSQGLVEMRRINEHVDTLNLFGVKKHT